MWDNAKIYRWHLFTSRKAQTINVKTKTDRFAHATGANRTEILRNANERFISSIFFSLLLLLLLVVLLRRWCWIVDVFILRNSCESDWSIRMLAAGSCRYGKPTPLILICRMPNIYISRKWKLSCATYRLLTFGRFPLPLFVLQPPVSSLPVEACVCGVRQVLDRNCRMYVSWPHRMSTDCEYAIRIRERRAHKWLRVTFAKLMMCVVPRTHTHTHTRAQHNK